MGMRRWLREARACAVVLLCLLSLPLLLVVLLLAWLRQILSRRGRC